MYKLLLVDDERIIREGISAMIDWEKFNIRIKLASNGLEAYEMIVHDPPDILITDIKMPGLEGLALIERTYQKFPDMMVVILSGYGEFDFASRAIEYGVKHYLLKPSDEEAIADVLTKIIGQLQAKQEKEAFVKNIKSRLEKIMPHVQEQFLRDCVMNRFYSDEQKKAFKQMLYLADDEVRLLLFSLEDTKHYEEAFALADIIQKVFQTTKVFLNTMIEGFVLVILQDMNFYEMMEHLRNIQNTYGKYYGLSLSIAISDKDCLDRIAFMYKTTKEYLKYRFYLGEGSVITSKDIEAYTDEQNRDTGFEYNDEKISITVKSGNGREAQEQLRLFFEELHAKKLKIDVAKTYCMELYMCIIRQAQLAKLNDYIGNIGLLQQMQTLRQISNFMFLAVQEITYANYQHHAGKNSLLISKVLQSVEQFISDEALSLTWLAKKILYMNEDYLGKLFKKEMNEKFSHYLMRVRMEKAKALIEQAKHCKVYNVADKVGYGNNPQYFGQVFKKFTGYTPSEYKKLLNGK